MLQSQREWLFTTAYALDNRERLRLRRKQLAELKPISEAVKTRLTILETTADLYVLVPHKVLEKIAEDLRELAANDEDRVINNIRRPRYE